MNFLSIVERETIAAEIKITEDELIGKGSGIHWPLLDEDLPVSEGTKVKPVGMSND